MKDKIVRAKETIQKHRTKIAFSSGILVGAGAVLAWGHHLNMTKPLINELLFTDSEMLQKLIDDPTGAIKWMDHGRIVLVNEANPLFQ